MSLIFWNIRGLCSVQRQNELRRMLNDKQIDVLGITETKLCKEKFDELKSGFAEE